MALALLHPDDEQLVKRVNDAFHQGKDHHESFRKKSNRFYAKYRSYRDFKREYAGADSSKDVDELLRETAGPFGTNLFIPYCFTVIETTIPRMLSQNPRMLITPADPDSENNVDNVRLLIDRQQSRIGYPLILQDVAKTGLIYGLGWQKTFWEEGPSGTRKTLERGVANRWVEGSKPKRGYVGPKAEALDPYDVIWDPVAHSVETSRWIIHRQWRDNAYVKGMIESGEWVLPSGCDLEDLLSLGSDEARDEIWRDRQKAAGYEQPNRRGDHLHEVLECHDSVTGEIITTLDRQVPVAVSQDLYWHGCLPFQTFRPTRVPFEMCGIGEIEAIEDLQEEMNILRSQRRDNAAIVLQRPYFYFDGLLDPADFVFGPGKAIPVDGDPRNVIFPAPLQDIPGSGYQEEAQLQRDIERTSGIELDQQFIVEPQTVAGPPRPEDGDRHYAFYDIGPEQLQGEWDEVEPEGGSMSPQSKIERQERAKSMFMVLQQNPLVNPRKLTEHLLEDGFEIENPVGAGWMQPEEPSVPPEAIDLVRDTLVQTNGVDPAQFDELVQEAVAQVAQAQSQGGGQGAPAPGGAPPGPGQAGPPEPVPA